MEIRDQILIKAGSIAETLIKQQVGIDEVQFGFIQGG